MGELYNLVRNGGFEEGGMLPAFWRRFPPKDEVWGSHLRDTNVAHSGNASGRLSSAAPHPTGGAGVQWNKYGIRVEGGSTLIVSYWVRSEGVTPAGVGIRSYDSWTNQLGFVKVDAPAATNAWVYARQDVSLPPEAETIGFVLYSGDNGRTWYDDVALISVPSTGGIRASPKIDGKLDDACWSEDRAIKTFVAHTGARIVGEKVRAWFGYDNENLYVAFRCPHPPGVALRAAVAKRDSDTWLDDSIEVFLDPKHQHNDYYQFCVNCRGVIRDSHQHDASWDSGAHAAVAREPDAWTIELAIPFERLGLGFETGPVWGVNLVWNNRVRGEAATWSLGGFHAPGRFGHVRMAPDLSRFLKPDLAKRIEAKERERTAALGEIREADLPADSRIASLRLLDEAGTRLDGLRAIARGKAKLPAGGWDDVRQKLAEVSKTIAAGRAAAVDSLFKVGAPGEFRVVIADSLRKIRRSGPVSEAALSRRVSLDAARDETESFQLVVVPGEQPLKNVTVEAKPLAGPGGTVPVTWNRIGYVETAPPNYATDYVGWWPDPLLPPAPFDVAANERQPLWFDVRVPPDAKPGHYRGAVTVRCGERAVSLPVELRVRDFRLPRPGTLPTAFGLYLTALGKWWFGKDAEKMPIETFVRWCEFLGERRTGNKSIAREYATQTQKGDRPQWDLSVLKQTVSVIAPKYFAPRSFDLFRLPLGNDIGKVVTASDPAAAAAVVQAFIKQWKRASLPESGYLYGYDETHPSHYEFIREAYRRIREVAPGYPIMQTIGDRRPQRLVGVVDIWCPLTPALDSEFYAQRRQAGDTLWTYVCCSPKPPYANFFVDQPAIDHRIVFWQARQFGATGFLYWCVCKWDGLPNAISGVPCFPDVPIRFQDVGTYQSYKVNGDGFLVYPGKDMLPLSSIRLEVVRDGIEDYEALAMLTRLVERAKSLPAGKRPAAALLKKADELSRVPESISRRLTDFTKDPHMLIERRRHVNDSIEQLTAAIP